MSEQTDMTEAALTDDEVAAIAYRRSRRWRAVLPSIDPDDAEDIGRAVWRGERSLLARGLLERESDAVGRLTPDLERLAVAGLEGEVWVSAYTGSRDLTFDATGFTYLNYHGPGDTRVVVEIVTALGLHRFGLLEAGEAERALTELVRALHEGQEASVADEAPVDDTLCLAFPGGSPDERRVYAVRAGVVETATVVPSVLGMVNREKVGLRETDLADVLSVIEQVYGARDQTRRHAPGFP